MIKICDELIIPLLLIIIETALRPDIPVHKMDSKNLLKNYSSIFLLHICGKIFEKCIFNSICLYLEGNNLFSPYQSGFL